MNILVPSMGIIVNTDQIIYAKYVAGYHLDAGQDEDGPFPARDFVSELTIHTTELEKDMVEGYEGTCLGVASSSVKIFLRGFEADAFWVAYTGLPGTIDLPMPQPAQVDYGAVDYQGTIYKLQEAAHPSIRWIADTSNLANGTHYTAEYSATAKKADNGSTIYVIYWQFDAIVGDGLLPATYDHPLDASWISEVTILSV